MLIALKVVIGTKSWLLIRNIQSCSKNYFANLSRNLNQTHFILKNYEYQVLIQLKDAFLARLGGLMQPCQCLSVGLGTR